MDKKVTENTEEIIEKPQLFNIEAEQVILGSIILNNEYLNKVNEILLPTHFYEPVHQRIYEYISNLIVRSDLIADSVTLKRFFEHDELTASIGGVNYLAHLLGIATGIFDIVDYARLVVDLALKRELVLIGEDIVNRAYKTNTGDALKQVEHAENSLFQISTENATDKGAQSIASAISETIKKTEISIKRDSHISGVPTDFIDLDKILGGLQQSDLLILAGRPSMGKTALAINIAYNAAKKLFEEHKSKPEEKQKTAIGFFSLEMSSDQLAARMLSMETGINSNRFRTGDISQEHFEILVEKANAIAEMPMFIDDTPALTISAVRTRVRRMIRKHNLGLAVIDYLQLLRGTTEHAKQNRVQEISEITQGLKAIAKEFNIPVLALSQLSRAVEQREDKRPQLADLRESGSIEQDADVVMFIYREEYYEERKRPSDGSPKMEAWQAAMERMRNKAEVIVAKHRNGPIGSVKLHFDSNTTRFTDDAGYLENAYTGY
jgi:replicative DNA helicase